MNTKMLQSHLFLSVIPHWKNLPHALSSRKKVSSIEFFSYMYNKFNHLHILMVTVTICNYCSTNLAFII